MQVWASAEAIWVSVEPRWGLSNESCLNIGWWDAEPSESNDASNVTYLPILMGCSLCYKQYMKLLGYNVWSTGTGKLVVEGEDGKEVNSSEFVTFSTYF